MKHAGTVIAIHLLVLLFITPLFGQEEVESAAMESIVEELIQATHNENKDIQLAAFQALAVTENSGEELIDRIKQALQDTDDAVRNAAWTVFQHQEWEVATKGKILLEIVASGDEDVTDTTSFAAVAAHEFTPTILDSCIDPFLETLGSEQISEAARTRLFQIASEQQFAAERVLDIGEKLYVTASQEDRLRFLSFVGNYGNEAKSALMFLSEQIASEDLELKMAAIQTTARVLESVQAKNKTELQTERQAVAYLNRYDIDGNGVLNDSETKRLIQIFGANMDRNNDNMVTSSELQAAIRIQNSTSRRTSNRRSAVESRLRTRGGSRTRSERSR